MAMVAGGRATQVNGTATADPVKVNFVNRMAQYVLAVPNSSLEAVYFSYDNGNTYLCVAPGSTITLNTACYYLYLHSTGGTGLYNIIAIFA